MSTRRDRFSSRLPELQRNHYADALDAARRQQRLLLDLTVTNPTTVGLPYPADEIVVALADAGVARHDPDPRGASAAREAIAAAADAAVLDPDRLLLCCSSSEAYAMLLKLLCDPGDEVLLPRPSYPLLEHLVRLEGLTPRTYRLRYDGRWYVDHDTLQRAVSPRCRALVVVNPNNPTGSYLSESDREALLRRCADDRLALIVDEVFFDYPHADNHSAAPAKSLLGQRDVLTFVINGLSKSAGLPQIKLSWIAVDGPLGARGEAMSRLELISDTYLSVSAAALLALPRLLPIGGRIRGLIRERTSINLGALEEQVAAHPTCDLLTLEAGWSAVLRVPALRSEEQIVLDLLEQHGVCVYPGFFFDFATEAFLILSLLPDPAVFAEATSRLLDACRA